MSQQQKSYLSYISDPFSQEYYRMGSFLWDDEFHERCYTRQHGGRPLSMALTEPCDPFEPQTSSFFDDIPYMESDFATLHHHHNHRLHHHHHHHHRHQHQEQRHRSRSSGRRYKHESYRIHYPNTNFNSYLFSPPVARRELNRAASREILVEKIETVTIEEEKRRPPPYMVSFVRAPSPPVRQLKIRPRPSSCFDLQRESIDIHQQQKEDRWSKCIEKQHEEHFEYNYNYNYNKVPERVVPIEREPPPPPLPPKTVSRDAITSTEDLYIPTPKPVRPETRDTGTTTAGLPRRPLRLAETQVIERYEKTEKVRCDSASSAEGLGSNNTTIISTLPCSYDGAITKTSNDLSLYSPADYQRDKTRVIVRSTSKPREALIDTSGIFTFTSEVSGPAALPTNNSGYINKF